MNANKVQEMWKDVEASQLRDPARPSNGPRKAPFYKVMTGMPIAVDAFCYGAIPGVTAYFLTHAHSDHYTSLSKSWSHGPIYCSATTASLIKHMLGVRPQWVVCRLKGGGWHASLTSAKHSIPDDEEFLVPNTGGVRVTSIEANHCPGSSVFLFEGLQTVDAGDSPFKSPHVGSARSFRYLHCGDFRACPQHVLHPAVARAPLDIVYLDTTYLNPQYCFPAQPLVIRACAELASQAVRGADPLRDADASTKPEADEDVKPDVDDDGERVGWEAEEGTPPDICGEAEDIKPGIDNADEGTTKPDIDGVCGDNTKPDVQSHPDARAFGQQERSVAMMEGWLVKKETGGSVARPKGRTLVLVGTYNIGKERLAKGKSPPRPPLTAGIARALGARIYGDERKRAILACEADPELHRLLDTDPRQCQVHLVGLHTISRPALAAYLEAVGPPFDRILAFRPTGWTYAPGGSASAPSGIGAIIARDQARGFSDVSLKPLRGSCRQIMMFGVPYSEHSSFFELSCFALSIPGDAKIIATVNVHSEKSRAKMKLWMDRWAAEKARRRERGMPRVVEYRDETYW